MIKKEDKICFFEINNKIIPNILYEESDRSLNIGFNLFFQHIPTWFMGIWIFLATFALLSKDIFSG